MENEMIEEESTEEESEEDEDGSVSEDEVEGWREDSENYNELIQDPNIRFALLASEQGINLTDYNFDKQQTEPVTSVSKDVDPNDPIAVLKNIVTEVVKSALDERIPKITTGVQESVSPLINDYNQRLLNAEYESLVAKNPAIESVGMSRILNTMQRHPTLTMGQAASITEPRIVRADAKPKTPPRVASSSSRAGSAGLPQETSRLRALQARAKEEMDNPVGIREKISRAFSKR
jgi:hypothetical protein